MGMIYVMSTPVSTESTIGTLIGALSGARMKVKKIEVELESGGSVDSLRFWIMGNMYGGGCRLYVYENGRLVELETEHIVANQSRLLEIDSGGNVSKTVAFTSRGMTKDVLENIPESAYLSSSINSSHAISVLISWEQSGANASAKFPVKKVKIIGKRYHGEGIEDSLPPHYWPAPCRYLNSPTYTFETPKTIRYSDFIAVSTGTVWNPTNFEPTEERDYRLSAGVILFGSFKQNGNWSRWRVIDSNLEDQTNVTAVKLKAILAVTPRLFNAETNVADSNSPSYEGPARLESVTFDRQSATGTYIGGNFVTNAIPLLNGTKKVHLTIVHRDDCTMTPAITLRRNNSTEPEVFNAMTLRATYRNEDRPNMIEKQYVYEQEESADIAILKVEGDGRVETISMFFH